MLFRYLLLLIAFLFVNTQQIGSIANFMFTYSNSIDNLTTTSLSFNTDFSCYACLCQALLSSTNYVAFNCDENNQNCLLFTSSANITGINSSQNTTLFILSYSSQSTTLSTTTSTVTSTTISTTVTTSTTTTSCLLGVILGQVVCIG